MIRLYIKIPEEFVWLILQDSYYFFTLSVASPVETTTMKKKKKKVCEKSYKHIPGEVHFLFVTPLFLSSSSISSSTPEKSNQVCTCILPYYYYYYCYSLRVFFPPLAESLSLDSEWLQVSSDLQDSSEYSGWSQQCCSLDGFDLSSDFRLFQPPF